ncbi:MAG: hypothetical protein LIO37_04820 [Clostridiales bacterium]|nr:hypothetical protein [Clostridiales bacterium]
MKKVFGKRVVKIFGVLAVIVLIAASFIWWNSPKQIYARNRDVLEDAVESIQKKGGTYDISVSGVSSIVYLRETESKDPRIEFHTSSFGVLPSAPYVGFYYSFDGDPVADEEGAQLVADGDGWKWTGTGDNKGTTWNIEGNWYAYTAWY